MNSAPMVSIVTNNYNNLKVTLELLQSIEESMYKNLQVIVVDNGSKINPTPVINKKFNSVNSSNASMFTKPTLLTRSRSTLIPLCRVRIYILLATIQ